MSRMRISARIGIIIIFFILIGSSGCSYILPNRPSRVLRQTVITVASQYLEHIVAGNEKRLDSLILWSDFLGTGEDRISRRTFYKQLRSIQNRWEPENHPLLGLLVLDTDIDGNEASVTFRKAKGNDNPEIQVDLLWVRSGWVIKKDTVFGRNGLIAQLNRG